MRRRVTVLATTALLIVGVALPAWAQPSFINGEVDPDVDARLSLRVPSRSEGADTVAVRVVVPKAFTYVGCTAAVLGWSCEATAGTSGTVVDYTAGATAAPVDLGTFTIDVHTPVTPGAYPFTTTETYADGASTSFTSGAGTAPTVTVVDPAPTDGGSESPGPSDDPTDQGGGTGGGSGGGGTKAPAGGGSSGGTTGGTSGGTSGGDAGSSATGDGSTATDGSSGSSAGGSAGPTRTSGTGRGSSFDVTTTAPATTDDGAAAPAIAPPVRDALENDQASAEDIAAAGETAEDDGPGSGSAQRLVGLALLLAGGAGLLVRRRMHAAR